MAFLVALGISFWNFFSCIRMYLCQRNATACIYKFIRWGVLAVVRAMEHILPIDTPRKTVFHVNHYFKNYDPHIHFKIWSN